jgi:hypothetical protein
MMTTIEYLAKRRQKCFATWLQVRCLIANGVPVRVASAMSREQASARLDELFGQRRRRA